MGSVCTNFCGGQNIHNLIYESKLEWVRKMDISTFEKIVVTPQTKDSPQRYYCVKYDKENSKQGIIFSQCSLYAGKIYTKMADGSGIQTFRCNNDRFDEIHQGKYEGEFKNNARHGEGRYQDEQIIFIGKWYRGFPFDGILQIKDNTSKLEENKKYTIKNLKFKDKNMNQGSVHITLPGEFQYDGQIAKNNNKKFVFDGKGKLTMVCHDVYDGEFKNGKYHGNGVYSKANNKDKYLGNYRNGKKHGIGQLFIDNRILQGRWNQGKMEGEFNFYKLGTNGRKESFDSLQFKNDELVSKDNSTMNIF